MSFDPASMPSGYQVRRARHDDLAAIISLDCGAKLLPHWADAEYAAILSLEDNAIKPPTLVRRIFVADWNGQVAGFAAGKVLRISDEATAELESVAVAERAQRLGLGRALCCAVIEWSRTEGAVAIELEVRSRNRGALNLYSQQGFAVQGDRLGYYSSPTDDAVLMRLAF